MLKGQKTVVRGVGRVELRNEETRYRNEGFKSFKKLNQKKKVFNHSHLAVPG